jgi:hypothetical protein
MKDMFINSSGKRNLSNKMTKIDVSDAVTDFPVLSESLTFGVFR